MLGGSAIQLTFVACVLVALLQPASASGLAGQSLFGYTFASSVEAYTSISKDVCDLGKALDTNEFANAKNIYANGKNVAGKALKGWANQTSFANEEIWGLFTKFYANSTASGSNTTWLDTYVSSALDNTSIWKSDAARSQAIKKSVGNGVLGMYMFHELDAAIKKAAAGNTSDATGAPHVVDEAYAIYAGDGGGIGENGCSLISIPEKRNSAFGTNAPNSCDSAIAVKTIDAFNNALKAARDGNVADLTAARDEILKQFTITYIQTTIQYAAVTAKAVREKTAIEPAAAEGYTFFWTIAPLVAKVNETAAETVLKAFENPTADMDKTVLATLESVYAGLGVTAADVGKYNTDPPACTATGPLRIAATASSGASAPNAAPKVSSSASVLRGSSSAMVVKSLLVAVALFGF